MKKLILILLMAYPSLALSDVLKLSCTIRAVIDYSTGTTETKQYNEIFEVTDYGDFKSIIPTSDDFASVTSKKSKYTESIVDYSDSNKWDITNVNKYVGEKSDNTSIRIDRNLGKIWYSRTFSSGANSITTTGTGDCEKVNVKKKKF